jgi:hypothetical protein
MRNTPGVWLRSSRLLPNRQPIPSGSHFELAFIDARIACAVYLLVALMWLIPDRRIERVVERS